MELRSKAHKIQIVPRKHSMLPL